MRQFLLAFMLMCAASQAHALSCIRPEIERSFNRWVDSENSYYIGVGTLSPVGAVPDIPNATQQNDFDRREPITMAYTFTGRLLDGGRGVPVDMPITVSVSCLASWCGNFPAAGANGLMALRGTEVASLTLDMNACPGSIFPAETETTVSACIREGRCTER